MASLRCHLNEECNERKCVFRQLREHLHQPDNINLTSQSNLERRACRFGSGCTTNNCRFRHPKENFKNDNDKFRSASESNKSNNNGDQTRYFHREREEEAFAKHEECINNLKKRIDDLIACLEYDNSAEDIKKQSSIDVLESQILELRLHWNVYEKVKSRAYRWFSKDEAELINQSRREIYRLESRLPVFSKRVNIENHFNDTTRVIIIQGQTGSGKSTQLPQYVADHPRFTGKRVICTQPRKIAAISLANRVAFEYCGGIMSNNKGREIGYHVGRDKRVSKDCRVEFVTEGVLLERIVNATGDIFHNVGCIIIDEAHERSVTCDILLGYFKKEDPRWKDILIMVTSATIDLKLFSNFFNGAPCLEIEGRTFPVDIEYNPVKENADIRTEVALCALQIHRRREKQPGDILCFLPGQEDVLYAQSMFETELSKFAGSSKLLKAQALALYGRMEPDEQAKVFEKLPLNERKVVFSTDVAETSVTIDGVVFVVDSGVKKEVIFDPNRNISSLKVTTISKSSAIQRAGRCGRTQPGVCYRLYSKDEFEKMEINTAPEIHRKPISLAVLTLRGMTIDPIDFDWISPPSKEAMMAADEELKYLGALDTENKPTELGKLISSVQQEPKIVKMIYTGCNDGFGEAAVSIASVMSVANIVFWNGNDEETKSKARKRRNEFSLPEGDIVTLYRVFEKWQNVLEGNEAEQPDNSEETGIVKKQFSDRRKNASKWCMENFVNGKAMNLALSTRKDLLCQFKYSPIWKKMMSQDEVPTNLKICRLACSGYFLNTARLVLSKKLNAANQYFALQSEVTGKVDNKGALLNSPNKLELPQWIIYDKIFRPSVTIFPVTSFIENSWIAEESEEFYHLCLEKEMSLPTEILTKYISQECLRLILGKRFSNVDSLEQALKCAISGDAETGRLELYCTSLNKHTVERLIDDKIAAAVSDLEKQVTEEDYLDGTRVVIGQGFEVKDVLFPQEYATLFIKNIPAFFTPTQLTSLLTQGNEDLGVLEVVEQGQFWNGIAKFCFKKDAKCALERLSINEFIGSQNIRVQPKLGPRRQISQGLSSRLKLSWAVEFSSGVANIGFHTAEDGNSCIEHLHLIFPGIKISRVHGDSTKSVQKTSANSNGGSKNIFPPVLVIRTLRGSPECRFRFDLGAINMMENREMFIYKITVVDLPLDLDEQDLNEILKSYNPKFILVTRGKERMERSAKNFELDPEEKKRKLGPLKPFLKTDTITRDFLQANVRRAGMYIFFNGNNCNVDAKEAYNKADYSSLGLSFGQRHRLEIDYTHSVSINQQLLIFLDVEFNEFKVLAHEKGIFITEVPPKNNSRFTIIRFRTNRQSNILWIQEQLEKITSCVKFTDEKIGLLFTWAGRLQMAVVAETGFVHWNNKNHGIWIYGNSELKEEISRAIKNIITNLSSMEILDKVVELDKKKINDNSNKLVEITKMCQKFGIRFHHFFGNKLYLSGSEDAVKSLESHLHEKGLTRPIYNNRRGEETRECGVCFCIPDEAFIVTILCGHLFCFDCIKPLFEIKPSPPLPITCPTCNVPVALNDILKCAPVQSLRSILEVSVFNYQKDHSKDLRICPKPDCSQILSYDSRTSTENKGGDFLFCNECVTTYCITCSEKLTKVIKSHEGSSCEDVQSGLSSVLGKFVREIQDTILNLSCPNCKVPFFEFDGCAAVTCASCGCGFCGLCLLNCGTDANTHSHVRVCPKNPQNSYYATRAVINDAHKAMRKQKIWLYLATIENPKIRNKVCEAISKDLLDLGIEENYIKSLFVEDSSLNDDEDEDENEDNENENEDNENENEDNENDGEDLQENDFRRMNQNYNQVPPPNVYHGVRVQNAANYNIPRAEPRVVRNHFEDAAAQHRRQIEDDRRARQQFLNELPVWLREELEREENPYVRAEPQPVRQPVRVEPQRVPNYQIPQDRRRNIPPNVNPAPVLRRREEDRCHIL